MSHKQLELTDHPVSVIVSISQPIKAAREVSIRAIPLNKPHPMPPSHAPSEPSDQTTLETANMVGIILSNITYGMNAISELVFKRPHLMVRHSGYRLPTRSFRVSHPTALHWATQGDSWETSMFPNELELPCLRHSRLPSCNCWALPSDVSQSQSVHSSSRVFSWPTCVHCRHLRGWSYALYNGSVSMHHTGKTRVTNICGPRYVVLNWFADGMIVCMGLCNPSFALLIFHRSCIASIGSSAPRDKHSS